MRRLVIPLLACAAVLAAANGVAQSPPPTQPSAGGTADGVPFDIPYGTPVNVETARKMIAAAEAEAVKHRWKMSIAVVDPNGELVAFARMDGAHIATVQVSQAKARTAARYRRETRVFYNVYETGHPYISTLDPTLVASPGGYPIMEGGKIVGAIGCSGGTGDQDAATCKVGADLVK
jgi:uncharacterized protein GlcG (DUF336 family)